MDELFHKKVRAAAIAGWWTLLVAVLFAGFVGTMILLFLRARPEWVMQLWGGVISWDEMRNLALWMIAIFRTVVWVLFLVVVWLSIWSLKLKRSLRQAV